MNAPIPPDVSISDQSMDLSRAIRILLSSLAPNTEFLFYRDDDAPPMAEFQHADGSTEIIDLGADLAHFAGPPQIVETPTESGSHAAWRPVHLGLPEVITDVLLLQTLEGFCKEEGNTLIRIGWLRKDGQFVATYASEPDGSETVLETITHWAPLPAEPVEVQP